MSKDVIIQEGGVGKTITADKLRTAVVGGGDCLWVPEDETLLTTKTISENGTYRASDDGYYGYSEVTVNGIGTATGTGPDGEDHAYTEDGQGGVTDNILPHSISVVTPPTRTRYYDSNTIDFSGMVVKAYLRSGELWTDETHPDGVIPISELTLPITTAHADGDRGATSDLDTGGFYQPIPIRRAVVYAYSNEDDTTRSTFNYTPVGNAALIVLKNEPPETDIMYASPDEGDAMQQELIVTSGGKQSRTYSRSHTTVSYTYDGKTVYYGISLIGYGTIGYNPLVSPSVSQYGSTNSDNRERAAWTAIYGNITGGTQTIPVQWNRPYDFETMETSFEIEVM